MGHVDTSWIAVDWGTSHLRAWVFSKTDNPIASLTSKQGMGSLTRDEFEAALLSLIEFHLPPSKTTPVICCGMVGSRQGWSEAPYKAAPCMPPDASNALKLKARDPRIDVYILPGIKQLEPADVMRGEETQIAGYLSSDPNFDGVICLPGTHTKWVQISASEVVSFRTFMTGELFSILSQNSVLKHGISNDGWSSEAFTMAIKDAVADPQKIGARLFQLRAENLLKELDPIAARAQLSGFLVGVELAAARPYWLGQRVVILGADMLASAYSEALDALGVPSETVNAEGLTVAGLRAAYDNLKELVL